MSAPADRDSVPRPCAKFTPPKDGRYPAFCGTCDYSRTAHERWDEWTEWVDLVGSEWDDKDHREQGRRIQLLAIDPGIEDGWGGPVYDAICIQNRDGRKVGSKTKVGLHGLRKRWRQAGESGSPTASEPG